MFKTTKKRLLFLLLKTYRTFENLTNTRQLKMRLNEEYDYERLKEDNVNDI